MNIKLIAALLIACFTSINAQNSAIDKNWKTYKTKTYTLQFPKTVKLKKSTNSQNEFFLLLPKQGNAPQEELSLSIQDFSGYTIDTEYYKNKNSENIKTIIPDVVISKDEQIMVQQVAFQKLIYEGTFKGHHIKWIIYLSVYKQKSYLFTMISNESLFDGNSELVEKIVQTFTIL